MAAATAPAPIRDSTAAKMAKEEVIQQSFAAGELSQQMHGRYELPVVKSGCRRMRNFIAETQGGARYRAGFRVVHNTRRNKVPAMRLFQFNDEQAYQLEFTHLKLRFYKDEGIILETAKTITGATKASPGVITSVAHGYVSGDEIYISGVVGMTELNDKFFLVVKINNDTYSLTDQDGTAINTTNFTTYSSAGSTFRIYEITTPYDEGLDLSKLKVTQNADTMYIDHPFFEPRKLTRTAHTSWTLLTYTRTDDPFLDKKVITGVTQASPGVITSTAHGLVVDEVIIIEGIVGMTELNSRVYKVNTVPTADTFSVKDYLTGTAVNTSAYTAYGSAGYASRQELLPSCPCFHEGRLFHVGMASNPTQFIGSMSPTPTTGVPRHDVYTAGADADDAIYFSIADSEVNHIEWLVSTNRLLMAGTFGSEVKITGETTDKPITPSSILVRAENKLGVADVFPINKENIVIYVQRGNLTLRSFEFDALDERFISEDRNLIAQHITKSGIKEICWQTGRPDLVWATRNDGKLAGLTFKPKDEVPGWHIHDTGVDYSDKFLSTSPMPRPLKHDQLWAVTERIIDSQTRRFVEFMTDEPDYPAIEDYFTDATQDAKEEDLERWALAMIETMKEHVHLDCSLTYDGSEVGEDLVSTITPSAVTGTAINITSNVDIWTSSMIGREIWKKAIDGEGYGRARITGVTTARIAVCRVLSDFDSTTAMAPGDWYLTTDSLSNLGHLEGRTIQVVTDGGVHPDCEVADGEIELEYQSAVVHAGLDYMGFLQPVTVEGGATTGPAQGKNRVVSRVGVRFLNSMGAELGTDIYSPEVVTLVQMPLRTGTAQLLYTGIKDVALTDNWDIDKTVYIRQRKPLPCTVQFIQCWVETDDA